MRWTSALLAAATVIGTGLSGAAPLPMRSASAAASEGVAVSCRGLPATIVGTPGRDRLVGTDGPDVIVAGAGPDLVEAHAGDDVICAGMGRDQIRPDAGDDVVDGGPGRDRVLGSAGSDRLDAGPGTDALSYDCGPGLFIRPCHAEVGVEIDLRAGTARQAGAVDRLRTSSSGGPEPEVVHGDHGDDRMTGHGGADVFEGGPLSGDFADGGRGADVCRNVERRVSCREG